MFSLFAFETPRQRQYQKELMERRLETTIPWSDDITWQHSLTIKADTYRPRKLFDVEPSELNHVWTKGIKKTQYVESPNGTWRYVHTRLPRGEALDIFKGKSRGNVAFDGDILIPALHDTEHAYDRTPWMSITPMEILSLRGGTRRAKGSVVVAGLGLGHQLIEVMNRKQVKSVVLVEKSQELVDWLLPRITPFVPADKAFSLVVGDAMVEMPKLTADVALVDIFKGYGGNDYEQGKLRKSCPNIGHIWCWGSANMGG